MSAFVKSRKIAFLTVLTLLLALCLPVGGVAEEAAPAFDLPPARGAVDMSGLETYMTPEAAPSFQLPAEQHPASRAEAGSPVLDKALGVIGLPGMSASSDDESTYEKAWRMSDSPTGGTRLTYGERYRRNPDGSYGAQSSSQWSGVNNVADRLLEQALSAGSGYFSSWAEGWLGGYGKARISVRVNDEGDVTGSGDFLYPIYDSERTTFFTQIGLRTMANDRVIGNFGLGQRFFPAENFALGYNVFLDQDFSRNHTRGGAGVEAWYDWLRLSANYYTPLSGWKDSEDYDSRLVEERPAEGYDARLTGYLPFYRNLAVTGAFEQWKGDHVGSFGSDDVVQKDPKIWSYGLEWTPVPAFSTSVNQRHSGGQKETQFGLTFNYHFGMDWEDQLSPAMVTEMRTVDGSRHDFVNRQNEMILEYRAKEGVYNIVLLRPLGANRFMFQITDGFGKIVSGLAVSVTAAGVGGTVGVLPGNVFHTDQNGYIQVELDPVGGVSQASVTVSVGKTSRTFDGLAVTALSISPASLPAGETNQPYPSQQLSASGGAGPYTYAVTGNSLPPGLSLNVDTIEGTPTTAGSYPFTVTVTDSNNVSADQSFTIIIEPQYTLVVKSATIERDFAGDSANDFSTGSVTVELLRDGSPVDGETVTWSLVSADNRSNDAVVQATHADKATGLAWGVSPVAAASAGSVLPTNPTGSYSTDASGLATISLTDVMGERTVTIKAEVSVGGGLSVTQAITFGEGPLRYFTAPKPAGSSLQWANSAPISMATLFPAADHCGTSLTLAQLRGLSDGYHVDTKLPSVTQLQRVSTNLSMGGNGAWYAAGWTDGFYWSGQVGSSGYGATYVYVDGSTLPVHVGFDVPVVCRRP